MTNMIIIKVTNIVFSKKRPSEFGSSTSCTSENERRSIVLLAMESGPRTRNRVQDSRMMELSRSMLVPIPITIEIQG